MARKVLELRSLIYGKFDSETAFADHLGWTRQRLNKITTGQKEPYVSEAREIAEGLDEDVGKVVHIFLRFWSSDKQHYTA